MPVKNFNDVYREYERKINANTNPKKLAKNAINGIRKQVKRSNDGVDITPFVGNDLLICANRRNGVLTEFDYRDEGRYTLDDVTNCFGSFAEACAQLKIIYPFNIEDKDMILKDLRDVAEYVGKIDETTYREYGAYSYAAIDKRWKFNRLLVEAGLAAPDILYPVYTVKRYPYSKQITWNYTYRKKFFGA